MAEVAKIKKREREREREKRERERKREIRVLYYNMKKRKLQKNSQFGVNL